MPCMSPPPIVDRDLLASLNGEASSEVEQHLARCADCRGRAAALARLERRLSAELYRIACPASEELGEYHLQLLPASRADEIRKHLAICPFCTREVAELQGYLADLAPDVEVGLVEAMQARVRVWIARLVEGGAMAPAPAFAGLRGDDEGPRVYEAGDVQISIEAQADAEQPGQHSLLGLLIAAQAGTFEAHLWQRGTHVTSVTVEDAGNFVIPNLDVGAYDLIVSGPGIEVHIPELEVGTGRHG